MSTPQEGKSITSCQIIPLIIYRVHPEEAGQLGILAHVVSDLSQLQAHNVSTELADTVPALPPLKLKPIAALTNNEGLERSRRQGYLWLLHPQLNQLQPYRGQPPLLALQSSYGFYEAYLPHDSCAVPLQWYNEAQLEQLPDAIEKQRRKDAQSREQNNRQRQLQAWRVQLNHGATRGK